MTAYKPRHRLSPQDVEFAPNLGVAIAPTVGKRVVHPLWPELGVGVVETNTTATPCLRMGRIRWSIGQVSTHHLATLREVE